MPTPNYAFEKRQRELAKKRKKEEKEREKAARKVVPKPGESAPGAEAPPAATGTDRGASRAPIEVRTSSGDVTIR